MRSEIRLGNLTIDRDRYDVWVGERRIDLTLVEFELLFHLAHNAGKVLSRQRLLEIVWGSAAAGDSQKLTVHISRLRKKITASRPWAIRTVKKRGYALSDARSESQTAIYGGQGFSPSPSSQGLLGG